MCSVIKSAWMYLCLLCGTALYASCSSTCTCPETCKSGTVDQTPMSCLFHADHSSLTASRSPNEAVCTNYEILTDPLTRESYCEFSGRYEPIVDMCQQDGSLCIIQNPNQKLQSCQKEHLFCNYLVECPPNQFVWMQCVSMDLPDMDQNDDCRDEVTLASPYLVNGKQSSCGSICFNPIISINSIEIKYGSSHCCHNHGFRLSSFCSAPVSPPVKKRDSARESCSDERSIEVPEGGKLQYSNQTIYVTFPSQEVLMYENIQFLFIEDNLKGNSVYNGTGVDALYGYGELEIIGYVAYYRHTTADPRLMPNATEIEYITKSINLLTDIVSTMTYSGWATGPSVDDGGFDLDELSEALNEALDQETASVNPFVLGIAKDLIAALEPLLSDK